MEAKPHLPVYHRTPNKFSHYTEEDYVTPSGNFSAIIKVAHFKNKNDECCTATAQVSWVTKGNKR